MELELLLLPAQFQCRSIYTGQRNLRQYKQQKELKRQQTTFLVPREDINDNLTNFICRTITFESWRVRNISLLLDCEVGNKDIAVIYKDVPAPMRK